MGRTLSRMAFAITDAGVTRIFENTESEDQVNVRNDGPDAVAISKNPAMTAVGADAFILDANTEEKVFLRPGEGLYAVCGAGMTASVEVI